MPNLSNKKLKYIRRHAADESPQEIADALHIPVEEVNRVLAGEGLVEAEDLPEFSSGFDLSPELLFTIFIALTPFIFYKGVAEASRTPQAAWLQIGGLGFLLYLLISRGKRQALDLGPKWLGLFASAFLGWCVLSGIWAENFRDGAERLLMWLIIPVLYLVALNLLRDERHLRHFMWAIFCAAMATALLGLLQYYLGFRPILQTSPPAATFVNKNMAMHFVVLATPVVLYLFSQARRPEEYFLIALGGALLLGYGFHTYTKGAWLALVAETLVLLTIYAIGIIRRRPPLNFTPGHWAAAAASIALLAVIIHVVPVTDPSGTKITGFKFSPEIVNALKTIRGTVEDTEKFEKIKTRAQVNPATGQSADTIPMDVSDAGIESMATSSLAVRLVCWKNTLMMWKDHPIIGVGLGNFRGFYDRYARSWVIDKFWPANEWHRTHNDYLQVLVETGVIGFALLLAALGCLAWIGIRLLADPSDTLSLCLVLAFVGIGVNAFFSFPFDRTVPPALVACFAAILVRRAALTGRPTAKLKIPRDLRPVVIGATAVIYLVFIWAQYHLVNGDYYARKVYDAEARKDQQSVVGWVRELLAVDPWNKRMLVREGRALTDLGSPKVAVPKLEELVATFPNWYLGLHNLAVAYQRSGMYQQAIDTAHRALKLFPEASETYNVVGCAYLDAKEAARKQVLEAAKNRDVDGVNEAKKRIAGYLDNAEEALRKAHAIDPKNREYVYNIGLVYYWRKEIANDPETWRNTILTAIKYMRDSIALDNNYALPWKDVGAMYLNDLKDPKKACECFTNALTIDPNVDGADGLRKTLKQFNYPIPEPRKKSQ